MISTDFAPNETWADALVSLQMLFQPWHWRKGKYISLVKRKLKSIFPEGVFFLFLTGRAALYNLLKVLNLPANSEVLIQAFTCEAVALPIIASNLKPVYVDIEQQTFSMDFDDLKKKITPKSKVLILQYTFGLPPLNRERILSFAKEHKLVIIEDLAHGFNPNIQYPITNNFLLLSFGRSKVLSSVFGGAIITNNSFLSKKLKEVERNLDDLSFDLIFKCLLYKPLSMIIKSSYFLIIGKIIHKISQILYILPSEITTKEKKGEFDSRLNKAYPNALAYLLSHQLKKFDRIQRQRLTISEIYNRSLSEFLPSGISFSFPLLRFPLMVKNRDRVLQLAAKKGIYLGKWYEQVVAPKELSLKGVGYRSGSCPQAEKICQEILNLPTIINKQDTKRVLKTLNDVLWKSG